MISQSTDRDRLAEALNGDPISYYCGFDPTAASLHIGNLVQLIKTVYAKSKRSGRRLSQVDQRYRKRAEELLHGELSVALGIPFHEVPAYIESVIGKPGRKGKKSEASKAEE